METGKRFLFLLQDKGSEIFCFHGVMVIVNVFQPMGAHIASLFISLIHPIVTRLPQVKKWSGKNILQGQGNVREFYSGSRKIGILKTSQGKLKL